jgi:hypothetical protein
MAVLKCVTVELVYATTISIRLFYTRISSSIRRQWIRWLAVRRKKQLNAIVNSRRVANRLKLNHLMQLASVVVQLLIQQLKLPARQRRLYVLSDRGEGEDVQLLGSPRPRR